jgi:methionyl-tRNA synthetase
MSKFEETIERLEAAKVTNELGQMLRIATKAHQDKRRFCLAMQKENASCWGELQPYDKLYTLLETITPEEYAAIMQRAGAEAAEEKAARPTKTPPDNAKLADELMRTLRKGKKAGIWNSHNQ